ncbi:NADH-quinone oxidoreductase subunit A [Parapedobacter lycopersici]|uniref:NADH-quinone oxidoreductase subunit A n=1 Tax=Parapedobacter lycopersici TaxID=1864939 RepID=UPI003342CAEC
MDDPAQLTEFGKILLMGIVGALLVLFTLLLGKIISPKKPTKEKLSTYECGEEAQGSSWIQFNARFYVIALVFLLFDVELIFIFPWATVFGQADFISADPRWGWFTLLEMFVFVGILIVGLVYVWRKGDLEWIKPRVITPRVQVNIPGAAYDRLNRERYRVQPFEPLRPSEIKEASKTEAPETKAPAFKPRFKKPGTTP